VEKTAPPDQSGAALRAHPILKFIVLAVAVSLLLQLCAYENKTADLRALIFF
jgi:hypothetical protein